MTKQQTITAILKQDNYKVEGGKVLRYDQLDEKFKPVIVSGNRIPLVKTGSVVEIFLWDDVAACIDGLNGAVLQSNGSVVVEVKRSKAKPKKQSMAKKEKKLAPKKKTTKKYVSLTDENISFIKSEYKKGTSKMAIARMLSEKTKQEVTRFIVMYHVKKIGKKK